MFQSAAPTDLNPSSVSFVAGIYYPEVKKKRRYKIDVKQYVRWICYYCCI